MTDFVPIAPADTGADINMSAPAPMYMYAPPQQVIHSATLPHCVFFQRGFCRNGMVCRFAHVPPTPQQLAAMASGQDMFTAPDNRANTPCRYFMAGNCRFGEKCHYSHAQTAPTPVTSQQAPAPIPTSTA